MSSGQDQRKLMLLVAIVIIAIAVAAFSAFRFMGETQGKVEGRLDMYPGGKQGEMQKQFEEPSGLSTGK